LNRNLYNSDFVKNILIISALLCIALVVFIFIKNLQIPITEIFTSWIISIINFVFGVQIFLYALDKPNKKFMVFSLGSIILRLFLNIILVLVLITVFKFQKNYFILSFLAFYFIYLIFEIYLLIKFTDKSKG
jgi:F0F1-type ATP synthase assembly protein I